MAHREAPEPSTLAELPWVQSQQGNPLAQAGRESPPTGTESCPETELIRTVMPVGSQSLTEVAPRRMSGGVLRVQATMQQLADPQHSAAYFKPHVEQGLSASWELLDPPSAGTGKWEALSREQRELATAQGGRHSPPAQHTPSKDLPAPQAPRSKSSPPQPPRQCDFVE